MKRYGVFICFFALLAVPNVCHAQGGKEALLGAWKLVAFEGLSAKGQRIEPYGKKPVGLIMYDSSGYMSAQFGAEERSKLKFRGEGAAAVGSASLEEIKNAYVSYYGYYGSYEVDEKEGFVIHHIQSSLIPNEIGINYKRSFKISGDRLSLTTPPQKGPDGSLYTWTLLWERVR